MDEDVCYVNVQFAKLLQVCRVAGTAPVHLTRVSRGYMVTFSRNYVICSTIFISLIAASLVIAQCIFIYVINGALEPSILSFMYIAILVWEIFSDQFPLFITICNGRKRFSRIMKYLRKINEINAALDSEYIAIKLKKSAVIFWLISTLIAFVSYIIIIYNIPIIFFNKYLVKYSYVSYYFNITFVFIMELQYIYVLCLIKSTINILNRRLKYYFTEAPLSLRSIAALRTNTNHLFRVYVSLCDLLVDFNNDEGAIILSFILFHISNITVTRIRWYLTNQVIDLTDITFWARLLLFIYECMRFIIFVEACHRVNVEDIRQLVSELSATSRGAHAHLKCFEMNMLLHDPVIAPLGLFEITRTFIPMVLGGMATLVAFLVLIHDNVQ